MRRFILLVIVLFLSIPLWAQLEVKHGSFKEVPGFVNINPDPDYQADDNDLPLAVIKVRTENINDKQRRELRFSGNAGTYIVMEYKDGEVWVYLTAKYADYLKISHPDFSSIEFTIPFDLKPKKGYEMTLVNKTVAVSSGWASLTVRTKPESGARVFLNGRDLNASTPYTNSMLPSGKYEITVSKNRFETTTQTIDIQDGDNKIIEIDMPYLYGKLYVTSEPSGASILVDGTNYGVTPAEITTIIVGTHELKLEKSDCAPVVKTITLDENNRLSVYEKLATDRAISISTDTPGDRIYIDGNHVGISPLTANLKFGEHEITAIRGYDGNSNVLSAVKDLNGVQVVAKTIVVPKTDDITPVHLYFSGGMINGIYSVSPSKKVYFSKGNLRYNARTKAWRFADNQWDLVGKWQELDGWMDLFGWGAGDNRANVSNDINDYNDQFDDWGNIMISNGGGKNWFTLTKDEWEYVIEKRNTSSGIRYAKASIDGVYGVILLPDDWNSSNYSLNETNRRDSQFKSNIITQIDWLSKLEENGAVFLPAAGHRQGRSMYCPNNRGTYWSATSYNYNGDFQDYNKNAYLILFNGDPVGHTINTKEHLPYRFGLSVRLVTLAE